MMSRYTHSVVPNSWDLGKGFHGGLRGPDPHDARDYRVGSNRKALGLSGVIPTSADFLRFFMPNLYNQQSLGSCVAWGFRRLREFITRKAGHEYQPLSPLWFYKVSQSVAGYPIDQDTGLYIRDGERVLRGRGFAREEDYPYDLRNAFVMPPSSAYLRSLWYKNVRTYRVESLLEMKAVIAAGHPIVFGFSVAPNFYDAEGNGNVPMPVGPWVGGHCCALGAYHDDPSWPGGGYVEGPNSWADFSPNGLLRWPYALLEMSDVFPDAWTAAWTADEQPPQM